MQFYKGKYPVKIGGSYKYPRSTQIFVLDHISENGSFHFKCGHWCTDTVFEDLIDIETGISGYQFEWSSKPVQLPLF